MMGINVGRNLKKLLSQSSDESDDESDSDETDSEYDRDFPIPEDKPFQVLQNESIFRSERRASVKHHFFDDRRTVSVKLNDQSVYPV